jgi:hypothetical protein
MVAEDANASILHIQARVRRAHDSAEGKGQSAATASPSARALALLRLFRRTLRVDCDCYNLAFQSIGYAITLRPPEQRRRDEAA